MKQGGGTLTLPLRIKALIHFLAGPAKIGKIPTGFTHMAGQILHVAENFWNIRGSYKIGGVIDVGTHASLVRRANGKFVLLDSYTMRGAVKRKVAELTSGGEDIEAILNVHPFHTVHVHKMHELYPQATLYGTARHLTRFPELPWADTLIEDPALHELFADDFEFSVPR